MWDVGGQDKIRPLWRHYYQNTQGIIFVIDSNDKDRIDIAAAELHKMLNEEELSNAVLLVFANKQDLPNALEPSKIIQKLDLKNITDRQWNVVGTCANTGEGLYEGLGWFVEALKQHRNN